MRVFPAALCFVSLFALVWTDETEDSASKDDGPVLVLTGDNWDETINNNAVVLAEFYAPWCGHCKNLEPEYNSAAQTLKDKGSEIILGKVDATVEKDLASQFDVSGYPTLKFFLHGKSHDYEGPRDASGIVSYMEERADPNWKPPPEAVIELEDTEEFDEFVNNEELTLVEFYAPWCGHCKQLAPAYEAAAKTLKNHDPPIPLVKVDATKATTLASRYGVSGYPTLKIFRKGKASEYKGPRDENGIAAYMGRQHGDACKEVESFKKLSTLLASADDTALVGFFDSKEAPLYAAYQEAGNELRDNYTNMVYSLDAAARERFRMPANSVAVVWPERFRSDGGKKFAAGVVTQGGEGTDDLLTFYRDHEVPLVGEFTKDTQALRYYRRPLCLFFVTVDWSHEYRDMTQAWRKKFLGVARDHPSVTFAMADEEQMKGQFDEFGFGDSGSEFNMGCYDASNGKYPLEEQDEFERDDVGEFVEAFLEGNARRYLKSQIAPRKQQGPVTVVVGNTFKDIVLDENKDVLIELYAPWCGHCKKFEPEYKKLAKSVKSTKSLVIAKMDATANDLPEEYSAAGFPTIYLAPAGDKNRPVKYEGQRDLDDLKKFIQENSKASTSAKDEL